MDIPAPSLTGQLEVLKQFLLNGDLVAQSRDAFDRVIDNKGFKSHDAQRIASIHQLALDARSSSLSITNEAMEHMAKIISSQPAPYWKLHDRRRKKNRQGGSILTTLALQYEGRITSILRLLDCQRKGESISVINFVKQQKQIEAEIMKERDRKAATESLDVVSSEPDKRICGGCNKTFDHQFEICDQTSHNDSNHSGRKRQETNQFI